MPCHVDEVPVKFQEVVKAVANGTEGQLAVSPWYGKIPPNEAIAIARKMNDLQAENDRLREHILDMANGKDIDVAEMAKIEADQIAHRQKDLERLVATFQEEIQNGNTDNAPKLVATMKATPLLPLQPQLGFDPNDH